LAVVHSAAFTLATYVRLLDATLPEPLELPASYHLSYHPGTDEVSAAEEIIGVAGSFSKPESGLEPLTPCLQDRRSTN
jgi:hypothetical protein